MDLLVSLLNKCFNKYCSAYINFCLADRWPTKLPSYSKFLRHYQFAVHYIIGKFIHRHFNKRVGFALMKIDYEHFAVTARRNGDVVVSYPRKPNISARLNFFQSLIVDK